MTFGNEDISEVLKRASGEYFARFLLYGDEANLLSIESESFQSRLNKSNDKFYESLIEKYPFINEDNEFLRSIVDPLILTHEEVFMEMGMQAGIRFIVQMLSDIKR